MTEQQKFSLLVAPPGFGQNQLVRLVRLFFGTELEALDFQQLEVWKDQAFCQEHHGKYGVYHHDFGRARGKSLEEALLAAEIQEGITGKEWLWRLRPDASDSIIILENIDAPLISGYLNGYYEEMVEFLGQVLEALPEQTGVKRCLLTGCCSLFLQDLFGQIPSNTVTMNTYHPQMGHFLGMSYTQARQAISKFDPPIPEHCLAEIGKRYAGYEVGGSSEAYFHPEGIRAILENCSGSSQLFKICSLSAFKETSILLLRLFRKMGLNYTDLLKLIHSTQSFEFFKEQHDNTRDDTHHDSYTFYSFITILHDFGLLAYKIEEKCLRIANLDAYFSMMRITDVFLREKCSKLIGGTGGEGGIKRNNLSC